MPPTAQGSDGPPPRPEIVTVKSPDYKAFYAHVLSGGFHGGYHFRLDFSNTEAPPVEFVEQSDRTIATPDGRVVRTVEASVYLSLPAMKEMVVWMAQRVKAYEDRFGPIPPAAPTEIPKPTEEKGN